MRPHSNNLTCDILDHIKIKLHVFAFRKEMLSLTYSNKQLTGRQFVCAIGTGENRRMSFVAKGPIQLSWPVLQNIQR